MKKLIIAAATLAISAILAIGASALSSVSMPSAGNATIKAIDVSQDNLQLYSNGGFNYNSINWTNVKKSASTVYIRASIRRYTGVIGADAAVSQNAARAKAAGMNIGYYHYFRPSTTKSVNTAQADFFYKTIKDLPYNCIPVIDVEDPHDCGQTGALSKSQITTAVQQFIDRFKSISGRDVMVYTYNGFVDSFLNSSLSKYKFWVARWTSKNTPAMTTVWSRWDMWQYNNVGTVSGISGYCDLDKATSNIFLSNSIGVCHVDKKTYGTGDITLTGWAISYYDVKRVDVYVDNKGVGSVSKDKFTENDGVDKLYSGKGYSDTVNCGYSVTIPEGKLLAGNHTVRTAMITTDGKVLWSSATTETVNIPANIQRIETVASTNNGATQITGYALSPVNINSISIYVDGKNKATISSNDFIESSDMAEKYANVAYSNKDRCRISYTFARGALSAGVHRFQIAATDTYGHVSYSPAAVYRYTVPTTKIKVELPSGSYTGAVNVKGWALSYDNIKRVDIYVDNKGVKSISKSQFTDRADVAKYYNTSNYSDKLNSGYSYTIPDRTFSSGKHTLRVALITSNKVVWSDKRPFTVNYPQNRVHIDSPVGTYTKSITVNGWALTHMTIRRAEIYVDNRKLASVNYSSFYNRNDVALYYKKMAYSNLSNSGFSYTIADGKLSSGKHSIRVKEICNDGKTAWSNVRTFTVSYPQNRVHIDFPKGTYRGNVIVGGWALSHVGVARVDVYIDGKGYKSVKASQFTQRNDVARYYSKYDYANKVKSGYYFTIKDGTLKNGKHTIRVAMISNNGQVLWSSPRTFKVA